MVEFALVAPLLVLALALAFQIAFLAYAKIIATNAAQEAARSAAVHTNASAGIIHRRRSQAVANVIRVRCQEVMPFLGEDAVTWTIDPEQEGNPDDDARENRVVRVVITVRVPNVTMVYPRPITVQGFGLAYLEPWPGPFLEPTVDIAPASGGGGSW